MKLPPQSVRKLLRENFSEQSPVVIDRKNLRKEARKWSAAVTEIEGVLMTRHPGDRDSRSRRLCRFTIPEPDKPRQYYRSDELRLEYDCDGRMKLCATHYRHSDLEAYVSDIGEIRMFVRDVLGRYARRAAGERKREKVRDFKSKAIIAQVKKLAKEEQFDFATANDTVKLKLYVRLSKKDLIEIHIPFTRFEKVLPKLRTTIQSLRELYDEGLRFKMNPVTRLPWDVDWISHKTL